VNVRIINLDSIESARIDGVSASTRRSLSAHLQGGSGEPPLPFLIVSNPSNPNRAFVRLVQCLPRTGCVEKLSPPNSSPARKGQRSCLCCAANAKAYDRGRRRLKQAFGAASF